MKQVALITGASRGIGRAIALELARHGWDIVLNYHSNHKEAQTITEEIKKLGRECLPVAADISKSSDRLHLVEQANTKFHRIDLLVNNAGIAPERRVDILETSEESFDRVMSVNLKGPFFLTQMVANKMIKWVKAGRMQSPMIINIGSISAYTSSTGRAEYCISKAGLAMMTQLFAVRLIRYGIAVHEIRPGIIETDMTAAVREKYDRLISEGLTPIDRWGQPKDVALAVVNLAKGTFPFSTGEVINVDGGFHIRRL